MVKSKHKHESAKYHSSRTTIKPSHLSRAKRRDRKVFSTARIVTLIIIILAIAIVSLAVLFSSLANPERIVVQKVEFIATDYYENYFYPEITSNSSKPLTEIMERYIAPGFARVSLRQLLLFDGERHADSAAILSTYCDTDNTYVQFFPESPFGKSDYHTEYHYSCTF